MKKVYLPLWVAGMTSVMLVPLLVWMVYAYFTDPRMSKDLGLFGFIVVIIVLLGSLSMVWLMACGRLPAYIIKNGERE